MCVQGQKITYNVIKQRLGDVLYKLTSQKFEDPCECMHTQVLMRCMRTALIQYGPGTCTVLSWHPYSTVPALVQYCPGQWQLGCSGSCSMQQRTAFLEKTSH
jgi:hypothetical protein